MLYYKYMSNLISIPKQAVNSNMVFLKKNDKINQIKRDVLNNSFRA